MDCNKCKFLSCTEMKQDRLKSMFNETIPHMCVKYNKRLFHCDGMQIRARNHDSRLYPCEECLMDKENKLNNGRKES